MQNTDLKKYFVRLVELAEENVRSGRGGPFAAMVINSDTGEIISEACNSVLANNDPTCHAEVNAIRLATSKIKHFELTNCILLTSCEPCPMCFGAIYWSRLQKIYFLADRNTAARAGFDDSFIYDEIPVAPEQRKIPMIRFSSTESSNQTNLAERPFHTWIHLENKTQY